METKTVNTELWEVWEDYFNGDPVYSIRTDRGDTTLLHTLFPLKKDKQACELIVTAVNACKTINPDNPLNVAKVIGDMHRALKMAYDYINDMQKENFEDRLAGILYDHQLEKTINLMTTALKQATE